MHPSSLADRIVHSGAFRSRESGGSSRREISRCLAEGPAMPGCAASPWGKNLRKLCMCSGEIGSDRFRRCIFK